jgi:hypothetical protein
MRFGPRTIYKITSSMDDLVYYVGQTGFLEDRKYEHQLMATSQNRSECNPLYPWLETQLKSGNEPIYTALEVVPYELRLKVECDYITKYLKEGQPLLNRPNNAAKKYMDCSLFPKENRLPEMNNGQAA